MKRLGVAEAASTMAGSRLWFAGRVERLKSRRNVALRSGVAATVFDMLLTWRDTHVARSQHLRCNSEVTLGINKMVWHTRSLSLEPGPIYKADRRILSLAVTARV